jgi:hypothetical protein
VPFRLTLRLWFWCIQGYFDRANAGRAAISLDYARAVAALPHHPVQRGSASAECSATTIGSQPDECRFFFWTIRRVALVCGETESVAELLQRLNIALGKAAAENVVIDEVLPEIKRRR